VSLPLLRRPSGLLPPQQQRVLDFVRAEIDAGRGFPSNKAIALHMGWKNEASAYGCLARLTRRGAVVVVGNQRRELVDPDTN